STEVAERMAGGSARRALAKAGPDSNFGSAPNPEPAPGDSHLVAGQGGAVRVLQKVHVAGPSGPQVVASHVADVGSGWRSPLAGQRSGRVVAAARIEGGAHVVLNRLDADRSKPRGPRSLLTQ